MSVGRAVSLGEVPLTGVHGQKRSISRNLLRLKVKVTGNGVSRKGGRRGGREEHRLAFRPAFSLESDPVVEERIGKSSSYESSTTHRDLDPRQEEPVTDVNTIKGLSEISGSFMDVSDQDIVQSPTSPQ